MSRLIHILFGFLLLVAVQRALLQDNPTLPPLNHDWLTLVSLDGDIYVLDSDTHQRYNISLDSNADYSPRWSPDGQKLSFESERTGSRDLFTFDIQSRSLRNFSQLEADAETYLRWSPNSQWAVFNTIPDERLYVASAGGGVRYDLTPVSGFGWAAWSPDGERLAYLEQTFAPEGSRLMVIEPRTGERRTLVEALTADQFGNLYWLASRDQIAYSDAGMLYLVSSDGSEQQTLLPNLPAAGVITWSPDERSILINDLDSHTLSLLDPARGEVQRLNDTSVPTSADRASWSPDSQWIVFEGQPDPTQPSHIYLANVQSGAITRLSPELSSGKGYAHAEWLDAERIAFVETLDLFNPVFSVTAVYVYNVTTSALMTMPLDCTGSGVQWSPGGMRFVVELRCSSAGERHDLYLIELSTGQGRNLTEGFAYAPNSWLWRPGG